jgi:ParB family chromosome partitioning protein
VNTITVTFKDLTASDEINARAVTKDGLDDLARSIELVGLIQPLAVRPKDGGGFEVIDGRRRFMAMQKLVKAKTWRRDHPVAVYVRNEDDATAFEISLIANTQRLPMTQIEQFEAFARMEQQGRTPKEIAERWGISEKTVRQRLALGRLAPVVRDAWKKGKIDEATAKAFARSPSHDVQAATFEKLKRDGAYGLTEYRVMHELAPQRIRLDQSDELALVGVEAYVAAGGTITEDLFDDARFVDDLPLAKKLAIDVLRGVCDRLLAEGWSWAVIDDEVDFAEWNCEHVHGGDYGIDDDPSAYSAEERAKSGCMVSIGHDGKPATSYGLIKPDDASIEPRRDAGPEPDEWEHGADDLPDAEEDDAGGTPSSDDEADGPKISGALSQTLSESKTVAVAAVLSQHPSIAMAAITAALLSQHDAPVSVRNDGHPLVRSSTLGEFPVVFGELRFDPRLEEKFAQAVATTLDLTDARWKWKGRNTGIDNLIVALPPTQFEAAARESFNAADYFQRAPKAIAIAALDEMRELGAEGLAPEDVLAGMKKPELAAAAAQKAQQTGWLPPELRHPAGSPKACSTTAEAA